MSEAYHNSSGTNFSFTSHVTNKLNIVVDEVAYGTGGRWGRWADGGGSSLELVDARADKRLAPAWADSDETGKSGWVTVEFTGVLDHGGMANADQLHLFLQGPGEALVDNVEVIPQGGANLVVNGTFDSDAGGWVFQGTHSRSYWQPTGGFSGGCLRFQPGQHRRRLARSAGGGPAAAAPGLRHSGADGLGLRPGDLRRRGRGPVPGPGNPLRS